MPEVVGFEISSTLIQILVDEGFLCEVPSTHLEEMAFNGGVVLLESGPHIIPLNLIAQLCPVMSGFHLVDAVMSAGGKTASIEVVMATTRAWWVVQFRIIGGIVVISKTLLFGLSG